MNANSNPYLKNILEEPSALQNLLSKFQSFDYSSLHDFHRDLKAGKLKRIVLTGMGSSYHALHMAFLPLLRSGEPVTMVEASELLHFGPSVLDSRTLLVVVSQSGRSAEVVRLLEMAGKQVPVIGVTNHNDSELARRADVLLHLEAGDEFSVSCKTYINSLAVLAVLTEKLGNNEQSRMFDELSVIPSLIGSYLSHWESHVDEAKKILTGIRYLILLGRGNSLATVGTGGLIIKESARFPAEGMSSAAFRHGPLEMISPELFVLVLSGAGSGYELNVRLEKDIRSAGGRSGLVDVSSSHMVFAIPRVVPYGLPLLEILPVQMLSLALAEMRGFEPGCFVYGGKVTVLE